MITGILILLPALFSLVLLTRQDARSSWTLALAVSIAEFFISVWGLILYLTSCPCQMILHMKWIESMGVSLRFGMDGISLLMVLLTTFLVPFIIASARDYQIRRPWAFFALILLLESAFIGVFTTSNGLVFYIFWELALIPAWFICALWGGEDRIRITFKFFIYTFTGSLFMLVTLIWLYYHTPMPHSFDMEYLYSAALTPQAKIWVALGLFLAFAIKIPVFPFHTWQPDTYVTSPMPGTILLAALMSKMGLYGMIRWLVPVVPATISHYGMIVMILTVAGILYASVIAIRQGELKRFAAYASLAHVGLVAAGILSLSMRAMEGAVIQMVSHGINITGLFLIIWMIEKRVRTREIASLGGLVSSAPWLSAFFMVILLANIALPLTNGFIGEFLLLLGIFEYSKLLGAFAGLTIIFGAVYMLRMYQRTALGEANDLTREIPDLTRGEVIILLPLVVMIFWIGINPSMFFHIATPAINEIFAIIR
jgi:NADH-quinone oxidoreductase subunit M